MKNYDIELVEVEKKTLKSVTCDVCKTEYSDEFDIQEFHCIHFVGGYGSVFGDGSTIKADICQHCLKKTFGDSILVE